MHLLDSVLARMKLGQPARRFLREVLMLLSIVTPFFNTGREFAETAHSVFGQSFQQWEWIIVNDASSQPVSLAILEMFRCCDPRVRVIVNTRNFGHIRSPYWGILQTRGDVTVGLASDLQDPPELIPEFNGK